MREANGILDFFWVEKYRPRSFEEILGQPVVKIQLRRIVDTKNLPNLLFFGPPGTGKSSTAEVVARELFGDVWEGNFTEINASDIFEQGRKYLEASRSLARFYDKRKGVLDNFKLIMNRLAGIAPLAAPYRILFINDAESLTLDAQQALRRIIERLQSDLQVHPSYRASVANYRTHKIALFAAALHTATRRHDGRLSATNLDKRGSRVVR